MNCPQCDRNLPAPKIFTNPKGSGWKIICECGFNIITDSYQNLVDAGLAPKSGIQ